MTDATTDHIRAWFLVGPTAVGKTDVAVALAEKVGAEIISADSRQCYQGMEIGTAAPDAVALERVPHHLVGIAPPTEHWSAGRFAREATTILRGLARRSVAALIVGGSGLYVRALRSGLAELPSDPAVRARLKEQCERSGAPALHARLAEVDPVTAARMHPRNAERVVRALEIVEITGQAPSDLQREAADRMATFRAPIYGIRTERERLYERIEARVDRMFDGGFLDEVRRLLAEGFDEDWPGYRTLGYPEAVRCIAGEISEEAAKVEIKKKTRHFSRRQFTWFRGEKDIRWFDWADEDVEGVAARLECWAKTEPPTELSLRDA